MPEDQGGETEEEESEEEEKPEAKDDAKAAAKAPEPAVEDFRAHDSFPPIEGPVHVEYCSICGLPPDFCQYGPSWEKCKPMCMEKFPQYYPELSGVSLEDAKKKAEEASDKTKVKELPGGKKKREVSPHVTIKKLTRGGRKCVTSIAGLDGFSVKLEDAAKLFKKKFSCGASVVKGDTGQPDTVDIQGDFEEEVIEIITKEFGAVPRAKIVLAEGGTKKKGKGKV
mmetsp:Transcript_24206/g.53723  ORF Transcript_24206/g.53723 Transcript_24206/m.53723 type:complete len:225 (-) Transcript_24206:205-879(-)|eukprot:CAMPEP_0170633454 /NCGR_PEP_ID=MMETSP0224-20130122/36001_1 /TAXON_ID=285029 /ORGANISM="Togula jolla, Strain CCCM 725" /LENGTH=224 /DNA_ID=CAMNT_0010962497 /DNA_START=59 /DNA_END=733 /DNA_ORIENTATION=+